MYINDRMLQISCLPQPVSRVTSFTVTGVLIEQAVWAKE